MHAFTAVLLRGTQILKQLCPAECCLGTMTWGGMQNPGNDEAQRQLR